MTQALRHWLSQTLTAWPCENSRQGESNGPKTCTVHDKHDKRACSGSQCDATVLETETENIPSGIVNLDGTLHTCGVWGLTR